MLINHELTLDLRNPTAPERIHVKQGDTLTHGLQITLFDNGEPWPIPAEAAPVIRWLACDPESGETALGIYDTLPSGNPAWTAAENQLELVMIPEMFALPGIVQTDVAFVAGDKILATANFEFYVNRSPANGTEAEARSYYKVATLEQINEALEAVQRTQAELDMQLAHLTDRVAALEAK